MEEEVHVNYPHEPGTLYNCLPCETICYCDDTSNGCIACSHLERDIEDDK